MKTCRSICLRLAVTGIPAFLLTIGFPVGILAQEIELEPIVVTATRTALPASQSAANVVILDRARMAELPARNLAEALSYLPGVFIDQNGGLGSQATAAIQGSEVRHVAVYMDGVPLNMLANPMTDLSKIPLDRVERIEVYQGAASSAWGSALGGVINVITRDPAVDKPISGRVELGYGEYAYSKVGAGLEGRLKGTGYLLTAGRIRTDGFDEHRYYGQDWLYLKLNQPLSLTSRITLAAALDESNMEDPNLASPGRWETTYQNRDYQSLIYETELNPRLNFSFNLWRQALEIIDDFRYRDGGDRTNFTYWEKTFGISTKARYESLSTRGDGHVSSLGLDGAWGEYNFSSLGRDIAARNWDAWISEVFNLGPWSLNLGLRYDDNQDFGSETSPSAGLVYRLPGRAGLVRFQWAEGFSAPPLSYLYQPRTGNPHLGPERGTTWQLGTELTPAPAARLAVNFFRADLEDMIYYDPRQRRVINLDRVRRQGVEISARIGLGLGLSLDAAGTWLEVTNTRTNEPVRDVPDRKIDLGLIHKWGGLTQSLNARWVDYNSSQYYTQDKNFVLDYYLKYELSGGTILHAAVHNLTDEEDYHYWYLPHSRRWAEIGLTWPF
ncbi:MAG: TonB-dependent receptor [Thermodesulfobacteriota bacterium]